MRCGHCLARPGVGDIGVIGRLNGLLGNFLADLAGDIGLSEDPVSRGLHRAGHILFLVQSAAARGDRGEPRIRHIVDKLVIDAGDALLLVFRRQRFGHSHDLVQPDAFAVDGCHGDAVLSDDLRRNGQRKRQNGGGHESGKRFHQISSRKRGKQVTGPGNVGRATMPRRGPAGSRGQCCP